jgi:hypothetical protein
MRLLASRAACQNQALLRVSETRVERLILLARAKTH